MWQQHDVSLLDSQMTGWGRTGVFVCRCVFVSCKSLTHTYTEKVCPAATMSTRVSWIVVCMCCIGIGKKGMSHALESYSPLLLFPVPHLCFSLMQSCAPSPQHPSFLRLLPLQFSSFLSFLNFYLFIFFLSFFFDLSHTSIYLPLILFCITYLVSLVYNEVACMSTVDLLLFSESKMSH